jgi:hypothetical protein
VHQNDGKGMKRKRRGRGTYPGVGGEGEALETVAQRRGRAAAAVLRGGGSVVREERKGGARGGEEVLLPLYRADGEGGRARPRRWHGVGGAAAINGYEARWGGYGEGKG